MQCSYDHDMSAPDTKSHTKGLRPYTGLLNECFSANLCLIVKDMNLILILQKPAHYYMVSMNFFE